MYYIYGYQNKINNKWYVGQTTLSLQERHRLHLSGAYHEKASDYNCLFHKKIREYGIENFNLVILEEVQNKEQLDEREQYWIKEKNSFVKNNGGYNLTQGGQRRKINEDYWDIRSALTKDQALEIIDKLKNSTFTQVEIAKQYNIHETIVNGINYGRKYKLLKDEEYPIRKKEQFTTSDEIVSIVIELLQQGYGNVEISKMLNNSIKPNTVSAINNGTKHKQKNMNYPIRTKSHIQLERENKAQEVKKLLEQTKLTKKEIAEKIDCDPSTVSRINSGLLYKESERIYPIRK